MGKLYDEFMAALEQVTEPEVEAPVDTENTEVEGTEVDTEEVETETETTEEVAEETAAEEAVIEVSDDEILTSGMESLIFLDTLRETCTKEEFSSFLNENKTELELYGLVDPDAIARESWLGDEDDEEPATEARNIVRLNRDANIAREEARIAIGLAKKSKDQLYKYYKKYSDLKRQFRDKIYAKYGNRAKPLARKAVLNARNRASVMNTSNGTTIVNKIDNRIKDLDRNGRNNEAVAKPVKAK